MEGPDHRPGIVLLEWPHLDLEQAVLQYLQQQDSFASVSFDPADLTLRVATKLTLTSRSGLYHYRIELQAEMSEGVRLIKQYRAEHTAVGSSVRWVTASDRDPIETALQAALEDLMRQIEADRRIYSADGATHGSFPMISRQPAVRPWVWATLAALGESALLLGPSAGASTYSGQSSRNA